jgi:hypothetical protein
VQLGGLGDGAAVKPEPDRGTGQRPEREELLQQNATAPNRQRSSGRGVCRNASTS